jgi:hypothetical protein
VACRAAEDRPHVPDGRKEFLWKKTKPLYIGEFLWLPSRDPSCTRLLRDEAYLDYKRYRDPRKAKSWRMQILATVTSGSQHLAVDRDRGEDPGAGQSPLRGSSSNAYQPIAAYCHTTQPLFYAGHANRAPNRGVQRHP